MNIDDYLSSGKANKFIKKPLSDDDLKTILGKDLKIVMYPDLVKYSTIDELLPNNNDFCVILVIEDENKFLIEGHWTALLKYDGMYEFFDPYANPVDYDLIHWLDKAKRAQLKENVRYLTYLLKGKTHIHNRVKYDVLRKGVNTCGSHCCYRIYKFINNHMSLADYQKHMNELSKMYGITYDKIVATVVNYILS